MEMTEVGAGETRAWRTVMNWLSLLFHLFLQIIGSRPSVSQILSYIGLTNQHLLPSHSFSPLPVLESPPIHTLTVVLDLDETLICAYETSSLPSVLRNQAIESGLKWFDLECVSSDKEIEGKSKISYVTVFERPGLHEFLQETSKFAELVLFTAGLEGYARPLVDKIDVENRLSCRLYRPSTVCTKYKDHVKDLSCLSKELCRTVIVDNNPFSFLLQPMNGIPCVPFSAIQPHDGQLLEVLLPLLKQLSVQEDVRPMLYEKFHMPEWFQKHGIPISSAIL